ncbi:conserved hypothetical protein [Vibrio phage 501E54-1]|nr:conserved hypothetical protein [Vibrio phage 501E54-1]
MAMYVETSKPASLTRTAQTLYYMYANGIDTYNKLPIYQEITTEVELEVAYKVYYKLQDDVDKLKEL